MAEPGKPITSCELHAQQTSLDRVTGVTALAHFILEKMTATNERSEVLKLRQTLTRHEPREQIHYLFRCLPDYLELQLRVFRRISATS